MEGISLKSIVLGFIAGAIAVVTAHELIKLALISGGILDAAKVGLPWSQDPVKLFKMSNLELPKIAVDAIWGGIWGAVFALILGNVPHGSMTLRGALLGILGPALIGVFVLLPLLAQQPMFFGGDLGLVGSVLLIAAGFGAVTAWLYGFMSSGFRLP